MIAYTLQRYYAADGFEPALFIEAHENGGRIGFAHFAIRPNGLYPLRVFVDVADRRRGIASAMHDLAVEKTGLPLLHGNESEMGCAFRGRYDAKRLKVD